MNPAVVAIIVTWNPDLVFIRKQIDLLKEQCQVLIIDNGSESVFSKELYTITKSYPLVNAILLSENFGIAEAQNTGISHTITNIPEASFVVTLDHDSLPQNNYIELLLNSYNNLKEENLNVGAVGSMLLDPRNKKFLKLHRMNNIFWYKFSPKTGEMPTKVDSVNSSGTMIPIDVFRNIGLFRKDFFIDHVETEWCFRAVKSGFELYVSTEAILEHTMGDAVVTLPFPFKFSMPYRSPNRHYYIFRNSVFMQKLSHVPITWKFWNLVKLSFTFIYFSVFSRERKQQAKHMILGLKDGLFTHSIPTS